MKIVIIVHNLTGGGAERVASLWASGFANFGYHVSIITETAEKEQFTYGVPSEVRIFPISIDNTFFRRCVRVLGLYHFQFLYRLRKILHKIDPDVCIGVLGSYALDAYNCSRDMSCKIINTEHNAYDLSAIQKEKRDVARFKYKMKFEINKIFDCVTVLSEADKRVSGAPVDNMVVLPNPLAFTPLKKVPPKENTILAAGRLDVWDVKGFDLLIHSWGRIAKKYPGWKLKIAGTGTEKSKNYLQDIADKYNLNNQIEFLGFCNDVCDLYRKSSIFVLSSRNEGFGLVLVEAMSQGCACIACDFKGRQKEIIQNDTQGIVCEPNDSIALSNAIEKMIEDDDYREKCRLYAIERSNYYTIEKTIERWNAIFDKIGVCN